MKVKIIDIHPRDSFFKHPDKDRIIGSIGEAQFIKQSLVDKNYSTINFWLDEPAGIEYGDTAFFFIAVKIKELNE